MRGAYHFEVEQTSAGGLCRFGWSTTAAKLALGTDKHGFGYGGTGKKSHGNQFDSYGGAYGAGDVLGCTLDRAKGTISYSKNGQPLGVAFKLPAALARDALYPAICLKGCSVRLNFGERGFAHPPPAGAARSPPPPPPTSSAPPPPPTPPPAPAAAAAETARRRR